MRSLAPAVLCLALAACAPAQTAGAPAARPGPPAPVGADPAQFERALREELRPPVLPSFTIPTDVLTSDEQLLARRLELRPGLYQGIAVVDASCGAAGAVAADRVAPGAADGPAGHYDDGETSVTVAGDGTGIYDAPGLHVAVLAGGAGVYDDERLRVSVRPDGSGTYADGERRLTVASDGSGSYRDADSRLWLAADGSGGYEDERVRVSLSATGRVEGEGDPALVGVAAEVLRDGLPRFAPVPRVARAQAAGQRCGSVIRLDANVLFDFASADVRQEGAELVRRVAIVLRELDAPALSVSGHTDHVGSAEANQALAERRAGAVRDLLVAAGVPARSLRVVGVGEEQPLRPEVTPDGRDDESARQLNRRVELLLRAASDAGRGSAS